MRGKQKFAGFTLIELLVVIVIIGVLATISVATFGGYQERAKESKELAEKSENCTQTTAACIATGDDDCLTFEQCLLGIVAIDIGGGNIQYWTSTNANAGTRINLATAIAQGGLQAGQKLCYNDDEAMCDIYGGLYDLNGAISACDEGFHLLSHAENTLFYNYIRNTYGVKLEAPYANYPLANVVTAVGETTNATNALGFGFKLGGGASSHFGNMGNIGYIKTSYNATTALAIMGYPSLLEGETILANAGNNYTSVRCLKD